MLRVDQQGDSPSTRRGIQAPPPQETSVADRVRSCVLIADNDPQSRALIASELEAAGFAAAQCSTVADAQSRLEGFAYDGFVVDVRLADGDGLDLLDEALTRYPNMR